MKNSRNDPFNFNICIRGLGSLATSIHSEIYEYAYHLTFRRSMKMYASEFYDPWDAFIADMDFFLTTGDDYVINCYEAIIKLIKYKNELVFRFGINEQRDFANEEIAEESKRYRPYYLRYKYSKSYKKLRLYYERLLVESIKCLYTYACVLTAQSYKTPRMLTKQFNLPEPDCYRLLNSDDETVVMLRELIIDLKKSLVDLRRINAEKLLKTIARRRTKVADEKDKINESSVQQ